MAKPLQLGATTEADAANVRIVATRGVSAPTVFDLTPDSTIIVGNSPTCGIQVDEPSVGPIQCMLALHSNEPELQPWPTAKGTLLNDEEVSSRTMLKHGDIIKVADCVLKVECGESSGGSQSIPAEQPLSSVNEPASEPSQPEIESPLVASERESEPSADSSAESHSVAPTTPTTEDQPEASLDASTPIGEPTNDKLDGFDDGFDSMDNALDDTPTPHAFARSEPVFKWDEDAEDDETVAILKAEIVELQSELAERDAQLEELLAAEAAGFESTAREDVVGDDSLIARVDDLLLELNESDERLSLLETMLLASETANRAEQEERRQLEAWVGDIETRLSENDAVRDAEFGLLRNRLEQMTEERDRAEGQLAASARANSAQKEHENLLHRLREENAALQQQVTEAQSTKTELEEKLNSVEVMNTQEGQQQVVDQTIREERAKIAKQQAELARERAELASKLADIERDSSKDDEGGKVDDRVQALREHLREIHQQEGGRRAAVTSDTDEGGLMSRIAGLWNKLDR